MIFPYLCIVLVFYALQPEAFALSQLSHAAFTVFIVKYFHILPPARACYDCRRNRIGRINAATALQCVVPFSAAQHSNLHAVQFFHSTTPFVPRVSIVLHMFGMGALAKLFVFPSIMPSARGTPPPHSLPDCRSFCSPEPLLYLPSSFRFSL